MSLSGLAYFFQYVGAFLKQVELSSYFCHSYPLSPLFPHQITAGKGVSLAGVRGAADARHRSHSRSGAQLWVTGTGASPERSRVRHSREGTEPRLTGAHRELQVRSTNQRSEPGLRDCGGRTVQDFFCWGSLCRRQQLKPLYTVPCK